MFIYIRNINMHLYMRKTNYFESIRNCVLKVNFKKYIFLICNKFYKNGNKNTVLNKPSSGAGVPVDARVTMQCDKCLIKNRH